MALVVPVILCGGSGTRLWPLSRSTYPKQFLVLSGDDSNQSLFQLAIERANSIGGDQTTLGKTIVVTNEEHRFLALDQLRELKNIQADLLLEPSGRNTAPALTLAALYAQEQAKDHDSDPILVVTPADQTIQDNAAFTKAL
jgi:mannose-1-phosphate guanylyltransferase / mannose-6-phosphate isomerase